MGLNCGLEIRSDQRRGFDRHDLQDDLFGTIDQQTKNAVKTTPIETANNKKNLDWLATCKLKRLGPNDEFVNTTQNWELWLVPTARIMTEIPITLQNTT